MQCERVSEVCVVRKENAVVLDITRSRSMRFETETERYPRDSANRVESEKRSVCASRI